MKKIILVFAAIIIVSGLLPKAASAEESCNIIPTVTKNPDGTFNLGVSVNTSGLDPNFWYKLVMDTGVNDSVNYAFLPVVGSNGFKAGFEIDDGHSGNTYRLYVTKSLDLLDPITPGGICQTSVTFTPNAPVVDRPGEGDEVALPDENAGTGSSGIECETGGSRGINTAIGCIPYDGPSSLAAFFLRWGVGIGGGIAFLLMVYAGFMIMSSTGNPERLKAGQELLTSSIAGLIMLIFSVFVLRLIGVNILDLPGFSI